MIVAKIKGVAELKKVEIYTDGACSNNPGVGGWAALLIYGEHIKEISGYDRNTTNNRMEMFAAIQALRTLKVGCDVVLYSDSAYLCDAFLKDWLESWQSNNWKTSGGQEVKNQDLWKALLFETRKHSIVFEKVKGHADNIHNNRCDELAKQAIISCQKSLNNQ